MQAFQLFSRLVFGAIASVLMLLALGLIVTAAVELTAVFGVVDRDVGRAMLDSIGYVIIAIAVFEVAKYLFEEEVIEPSEMRHTGEARRSITKFVSTIAIAVFLEALLAIFETSRADALEQMLYPTLLLFTGVLLIIGLGLYQRLSVAAEQVIANEPGVESEEDGSDGQERQSARTT